MKDKKIHLCDSCIFKYPNCKSGTDVQFGTGIGNDNIIVCAEYKKLKKELKK